MLYLLACTNTKSIEEASGTTDDTTTTTDDTTTVFSGLFVAVGTSGYILTSSDGTSWTSRTSGTTSSPIGIPYGNSKFLTLTGTMDDGTDSPATVLTSANGTSWTSTSVTCSSCG